MSVKFMKLICPVGIAVTAPFIVPKVFAKEMVDCHACHIKRLPKAHELPLYDTSPEKTEGELVEQHKSSLEEAISTTRQTAAKYLGALDGGRKRAVEVYNTGVAHSKSTYDYITEEENVVPRVAAIASGGLFGLLLAIRGGKFKKVVYTSLGTVAVASACYPAQAKDYVAKGYSIAAEQTTELVKQYGGYDLNNASSDIKEKMNSLSISGTLGNLNISGKISGLTHATKDFINKSLFSKKSDQATEGDVGQSKPEDKDLYTTRTK